MGLLVHITIFKDQTRAGVTRSGRCLWILSVILLFHWHTRTAIDCHMRVWFCLHMAAGLCDPLLKFEGDPQEQMFWRSGLWSHDTKHRLFDHNDQH